MTRKMRISWKAPLLAAIVVGVLASAAGARQTAVPGPAEVGMESTGMSSTVEGPRWPTPITYDLQWQLFDPCDCEYRGATSVDVRVKNQDAGYYQWYEPYELDYPVTKRVIKTVPVICDASKLACNALTKEHHLRGGPLP